MPLLGVRGFLNIISSPLSQLSVVNLSIVVLGKRNKCTKKLKKTKPSCSGHTARKGVYSLSSLPCSLGRCWEGAGRMGNHWPFSSPAMPRAFTLGRGWKTQNRNHEAHACVPWLLILQPTPESSMAFPCTNCSWPQLLAGQTVVDLNFWHYEGRLFSHLRPCPYFSVIYTNY